LSNDSFSFLNQDHSDKANRSLERLSELFPNAEIPEGVKNLAGSEASSNDLYMNLKRQLDDGAVSKSDKLLIATALASATASKQAIQFFGNAAADGGASKQNISDAIGVASICTIFNQYYHFKSIGGEDFKNTRASFNANAMVQTSLTKAQTELICVAVSSYNNCHDCVDAHWKKAKDAGVTADQMDEVIKILSVVTAFANVCSGLDSGN